jgi:predicted AAA+ superfamily ATPase
MYRKITEKLQQWLISPNRKPLIIRGARQVGKTWAVRNFAVTSKKQLIEINFEQNPKIYTSFLVSNNPKEILKDLELSLNINIDIANSILFIDEIQVKPECLAKLRWFAEDLPELPVISAGSLLEFVLQAPTFSMPVGRINYLFLEPMSFEEFLLAGGNENLYQFLCDYRINLNTVISDNISDNIHEKLLKIFQEYILVGGMPAVCQEYFTQSSIKNMDTIQNNLITTYRDDFHKYNKKIVIERLDEVMYSVPLMLGNKYTYSKVNPNIKSQEIKNSLYLLAQARICHYVYANYANGLPMGAQINQKFFKMIFVRILWRVF